MGNYIVYVTIDTDGNITAVNSSAFISDVVGWVQIDEGLGDRFCHAQNNYFDKPIMDNNGCYNYKFADGVVTEKTVQEKQAEIAVRPLAPPTMDEFLLDLDFRLSLVELGI